MTNFDFDPMMDPTEFFVWDELIDPGKKHQCPNCGRLLEDSGGALGFEDSPCAYFR